MHLIKLHSIVDYQPSARNHVVFLPDVDMSYEAIYSDPTKKPLHLQNGEYQSFTQPIEGIHIPNSATLDYPLAGNLCMPHRANTEATAGTITQRTWKHVCVSSMTMSFWYLCIGSMISIMNG